MDALLRFLDRYRVPYRQAGQDKHVSKRGWLGVPCPWCGGSGFHLGIQPTTGRANCWKCGGRNATQAVALLCRVTDREAAKVFGYVRPTKTPQTVRQSVFQRPAGLGPLLPAHERYLERRGFEPSEIVRLWKIQGLGPACKLKWRIYIPIFTPDGLEVSWTTRAIGKSSRRYHSASEEQEAYPHKNLLYGAHLARQTIIVCEGPIDAWAIGPGAVATCGMVYSPAQVAAMAEYPVRIVCFDSTSDAQQRAEKLCQRLTLFSGHTENVMLETGSDAAEADREEVDELRRRYLFDAAVGDL